MVYLRGTGLDQRDALTVVKETDISVYDVNSSRVTIRPEMRSPTEEVTISSWKLN